MPKDDEKPKNKYGVESKLEIMGYTLDKDYHSFESKLRQQEKKVRTLRLRFNPDMLLPL